jgi:hypothetical protein
LVYFGLLEGPHEADAPPTTFRERFRNGFAFVGSVLVGLSLIEGEFVEAAFLAACVLVLVGIGVLRRRRERPRP